MRRWSFGALTALLVALPALGQFEGVIEMKTTMSQGSGKMKLYISKAGSRNEMDMNVGEMPMRMTILTKAGLPDVAYRINDAGKTYSEIDLKNAREAAEKRKEPETYEVKKLGKETLSGYSCQHVIVKTSRGNELELWTTREILDYGAFMAGLGRNAAGDSGLRKAMKDADADGFFVKMITRAKNEGEGMTVELVKAEKKSLPGSLFEVPAGYTKQEGMMGAMSPEQQERMKEMMKNLTPEQREMIEKRMKQGAPGN